MSGSAARETSEIITFAELQQQPFFGEGSVTERSAGQGGSQKRKQAVLNLLAPARAGLELGDGFFCQAARDKSRQHGTIRDTT
jgi:hypothetical protein